MFPQIVPIIPSFEESVVFCSIAKESMAYYTTLESSKHRDAWTSLMVLVFTKLLKLDDDRVSLHFNSICISFDCESIPHLRIYNINSDAGIQSNIHPAGVHIRPACYFPREEYALPKDEYSPVSPASKLILCLSLPAKA